MVEAAVTSEVLEPSVASSDASNLSAMVEAQACNISIHHSLLDAEYICTAPDMPSLLYVPFVDWVSVTHSQGSTDLQTLYVSKLYKVSQHCKGRRMHLVQGGEASLCVACCNEHTLTANWLNDGSLGVLRQEAGELHSPCTHACIITCTVAPSNAM